jgi:citrate lyase synthetase
MNYLQEKAAAAQIEINEARRVIRNNNIIIAVKIAATNARLEKITNLVNHTK